MGGDINLVGSRTPIDILKRELDSDETDLTIADTPVHGDGAIYTWRNPKDRFSPGRLDFLLYSDGSLSVVNAFVLDTTRLADEVLNESGLDLAATNSSDHLPVVIDIKR